MRGSAQRPLALFRPFLVFPHLFALEKLIPPPLFRKTSPFRPEKRVNIGFLQGIPRLPPLLLREKNTPFSLFRPPSALFAFGNEPAAKRRNMQERTSDQSDLSENIQEREPPTSPTSPRTSKREDLRPVRQVRPVREYPKKKRKIEKLLSFIWLIIEKLLSLYCQLKQEPNEVQRVSPKNQSRRLEVRPRQRQSLFLFQRW